MNLRTDDDDRLHHCANCYHIFKVGESFLFCADCGLALCVNCCDGHEGFKITKIAGTFAGRVLAGWLRIVRAFKL